jgi:cyclophilin family peptidyl-prolyl cis-trans isomerase
MANSGPNTNGSQFFILHQDYPLPPNYVIFAKVTAGMATVDALADTPTRPDRNGEPSLPLTAPVIRKITIRP